MRAVICACLLLASFVPANGQTIETTPQADPQSSGHPSPPKNSKTEAYPETSGDLVHYPGIPPTQRKIESTIGDYKLRFYGTLLLNFSYSNIVVDEDLPLWAISGSLTMPVCSWPVPAARVKF